MERFACVSGPSSTSQIRVFPCSGLLGCFWFSLALLAWIPVGDAQGQTAAQLRRDSRQAVLDAQIGNQQVQRQTEIMRLERMLRQFESRVIRLERQLMSVSRLPTITMAEAKAGVEFAEVQLRESEELHKKGEIDRGRPGG